MSVEVYVMYLPWCASKEYEMHHPTDIKGFMSRVTNEFIFILFKFIMTAIKSPSKM